MAGALQGLAHFHLRCYDQTAADSGYAPNCLRLIRALAVETHENWNEAASQDGWTTFTIILPDRSGEEI